MISLTDSETQVINWGVRKLLQQQLTLRPKTLKKYGLDPYPRSLLLKVAEDYKQRKCPGTLEAVIRVHVHMMLKFRRGLNT